MGRVAGLRVGFVRSAGVDQGCVSAEELKQLRRFPEVDRAELIRYFTLTLADEAFVRQFRGLGNVLGDKPSRSLAQDAGQKQVLLPAVENAALAPS